MGAAAETADFAVLLEELKGRSGLSYGTLGKRLHMSPSTLHRYCRGEALPSDYGSVERLARLCKASPDELLELHRRWIAAVAARDRERRTSAPAPAPEPAAPAPAPVPAPEPAAPAPLPAPVPPPAPAPPPVTAQAPVPRRRRPAARVAVSVAAVLAVVAAAGVVVTLFPDGDGDGRETFLPGGTADAGTEPAPFATRLVPNAWEDSCSQFYLVDDAPADVGPPPGEQDADRWVDSEDAVPADGQFIELTVQGTGPETVVLQDLHVRVVDSGDPLPWQVYGMGVGCGGDVRVSAYDVDLDAARPEAVPGDGVSEFPRSVSESEPEVMRIRAVTADRDVRWYLELDWSSGDREGTLRIDAGDGEPFRTSGTSAATGRWVYPLGNTEWIVEPPH